MIKKFVGILSNEKYEKNKEKILFSKILKTSEFLFPIEDEKFKFNGDNNYEHK